MIISKPKNSFYTEYNLVDDFVEVIISKAFQNSLEADLIDFKKEKEII